MELRVLRKDQGLHSNSLTILSLSNIFTVGLHLIIAKVIFKFIVHNSERIILILCSQSNLGAKNEVIFNFNTYLDI